MTSQIVNNIIRQLVLDLDLPTVLSVLLYLVLGELLTTERTRRPLLSLLTETGVTKTRTTSRMGLYHRPVQIKRYISTEERIDLTFQRVWHREGTGRETRYRQRRICSVYSFSSCSSSATASSPEAGTCTHSWPCPAPVETWS